MFYGFFFIILFYFFFCASPACISGEDLLADVGHAEQPFNHTFLTAGRSAVRAFSYAFFNCKEILNDIADIHSSPCFPKGCGKIGNGKKKML